MPLEILVKKLAFENSGISLALTGIRVILTTLSPEGSVPLITDQNVIATYTILNKIIL